MSIRYLLRFSSASLTPLYTFAPHTLLLPRNLHNYNYPCAWVDSTNRLSIRLFLITMFRLLLSSFMTFEHAFLHARLIYHREFPKEVLISNCSSSLCCTQFFSRFCFLALFNYYRSYHEIIWNLSKYFKQTYCFVCTVWRDRWLTGLLNLNTKNCRNVSQYELITNLGYSLQKNECIIFMQWLCRGSPTVKQSNYFEIIYSSRSQVITTYVSISLSFWSKNWKTVETPALLKICKKSIFSLHSLWTLLVPICSWWSHNRLKFVYGSSPNSNCEFVFSDVKPVYIIIAIVFCSAQSPFFSIFASYPTQAICRTVL